MSVLAECLFQSFQRLAQMNDLPPLTPEFDFPMIYYPNDIKMLVNRLSEKEFKDNILGIVRDNHEEKLNQVCSEPKLPPSACFRKYFLQYPNELGDEWYYRRYSDLWLKKIQHALSSMPLDLLHELYSKYKLYLLRNGYQEELKRLDTCVRLSRIHSILEKTKLNTSSLYRM